MGRYDDQYPPYVPVAERRAQAAREVAKRRKKGQITFPVSITGRSITSTFWGQSWCANLEGYSDYENRLPRGRTYARNGSIVHLKIASGRIEALVSGSELYEIQIDIVALPRQNWRELKVQCTGKIGSLVELLQGKLSKAVMEKVTNREAGLFPKPKEIKMRCSCPDGARMCKHIAAAMYGVGNRLDSSPELLFLLRGVDHLELIDQAIPTAPLGTNSNAPTLAIDDLGAIFDIEFGDAPVANAAPTAPGKLVAKQVGKKAHTKKKVADKKAAAAISEKQATKQVGKKATTKKKAAVTKVSAIPEKQVANQVLKAAKTVKKSRITQTAAATIPVKPAAKQVGKKSKTVKKTSLTKKKQVKPVTK